METADQNDSNPPSDLPTGAMPVAPEILPPALHARPGHLSDKLMATMPAILHRSGRNAEFAAREFFFGTVRNEHTRRAYLHALKRFLSWTEKRGIPELKNIAPWDLGEYFSGLKGSPATRNQHLSALRHFFDAMVMRHAVAMNPARSVRGERYAAIEGKTPEISVEQARTLLASMTTAHVVGLRDRAVLAVLIYTSARAGAVAGLACGDFYNAGNQWMLHFNEKGGKSREIPVRHDLQITLAAYIESAGLRNAAADAPLFQSAYKRQRVLTGRPMHINDICRMMKRRLKDIGLPLLYSPHSFRVTTITDLLTQGVPLEDVQRLAGHADPRTTRLYDRRDGKITRNVVERISV
jgi:integrase/recombinase XerD